MSCGASVSTVGNGDVSGPWNAVWNATSPPAGHVHSQGVHVGMGLTSLVQPEGFLEVAECGWCVGLGDIHQDRDGTASPGLEGAGMGALCPHTHFLTKLPCIFPE